MDALRELLSFFLHLDDWLRESAALYGGWIYLILFLIIFCETGLVVTPFLPGDSLLFAAGAVVAIDTSGSLNFAFMWVLLVLAAIAGDTVNYTIGKFAGQRLLARKLPFVRQEYIDRTHEYFEKYGGKTIILARFVPIVRTFAPFVAGIGSMNYPKFITYNVVGALLWVTIFLTAGYLIGNLPIVQENFTIVEILIILLSITPIVYEFLKSRRQRAVAKQAQA
ncbi:MAG: DedA family protein [Chloroflexales bacterium]|nr:DedA family protein [Chloroflexales bacterium]